MPRSFSYWDPAARDWKIAAGCHRISVGASSRDLRLGGTISRGGASCPPPCAAATGTIRNSTLGRVRLGRTRAHVRNAFPSFVREAAALDRFCLAGKRRVRVGYVRGRTVLALTDAKRYGASGVRPGDPMKTLLFRTGARELTRHGSSTWYLRTGRAASRLYRVSGGRVREVAIASRSAGGTPDRARRLLRTLGLAR